MIHHTSRSYIEQFVVSATEMAAVEEQMFAAGMPVAALMEKVAGLITERVTQLYPLTEVAQVGVMIGPGHNGGDAVVVARELFLRGYTVLLYRPLNKGKELTQAHLDYATNLGIAVSDELSSLHSCDLIIDGLFGFGMTRSLQGELATVVATINQWSIPVVSIDLPSGIHTDTGEVLGSAIAATHTFCLGLWKRAFFQDQAVPYFGQAELLDFGIPVGIIETVLGFSHPLKRMSASLARSFLPLPRPRLTHKYQQGHLLLIAGSAQYAGGVILTGLGARSSGVGMVTIAAPASLKPMLVSHLPEALIVACPETEQGAIANLPEVAKQWDNYSAIAAGPGLTLQASSLIPEILETTTPLMIDADGLNTIAQMNPSYTLSSRSGTTILTPHPGEFRRLFPHLELDNRISSVQQAVVESNSHILLKGAKSIIAGTDQTNWVVAESTPALARGGSGDVLTGLLGGLMAQPQVKDLSPATVTATATVWHAQAGIIASQSHSDLGVDAFTLTQYLSQFPVTT